MPCTDPRPSSVENCGTEADRLDCVVDKTFVNLASLFADRVEWKVSVEVDVHSAKTVEEIVARAKRMKAMFQELAIAVSDKILFKVPATWKGIEAVRRLEEEGIHCHVTHVYCLEQAALAIRANAALLQTYVGRTNTWYASRAAETKANCLGEGVDPSLVGVELTRQIDALVRCHKGKTKIIAASVRNREEAIALAGCDFLLLNERVIAALNEKPSADKVRTIHWFPYDRFRVVNADP